MEVIIVLLWNISFMFYEWVGKLVIALSHIKKIPFWSCNPTGVAKLCYANLLGSPNYYVTRIEKTTYCVDKERWRGQLLGVE